LLIDYERGLERTAKTQEKPAIEPRGGRKIRRVFPAGGIDNADLAALVDAWPRSSEA